jgi:cytidine deaminase
VIEKELLDRLVGEALAARELAYTPYSHYKVGAAVLTESGNVYAGCNVENVAYTPTIHAEQAAIINAIIHGEAQDQRDFLRALVVVHEGNSMPCGLCRQVIEEFSKDDEVIIINANLEGEILGIKTLAELLPDAFGPKHLGIE